MQKVEGSSPFIRFKESPATAGFLVPGERPENGSDNRPTRPGANWVPKPTGRHARSRRTPEGEKRRARAIGDMRPPTILAVSRRRHRNADVVVCACEEAAWPGSDTRPDVSGQTLVVSPRRCDAGARRHRGHRPRGRRPAGQPSSGPGDRRPARRRAAGRALLGLCALARAGRLQARCRAQRTDSLRPRRRSDRSAVAAPTARRAAGRSAAPSPPTAASRCAVAVGSWRVNRVGGDR